MNKEVADNLRQAVKTAGELDDWHGFGEGYNPLRMAVEIAIKHLDPSEPPQKPAAH